MDFGIDNAIYSSFKLLRKNFSKTLKFFIVVAIAYIINSILMSQLESVLSSIESWIFGAFVQIAIVTFTIGLLKKRKIKYKERLTNWDLVFRLILGNLVSLVITVFGFIALIIPGIVFAVRLAYTKYLIIEQGMGPIEAVKGSWKLTEDRFFTLLGLGIVFLLINVLGLLLLVLGLFFTIPLTSIASAWVYLKLSEK